MVNSNTKVAMGGTKGYGQQNQHVTRVLSQRRVAASALQSPVGRTRSGCSEGFSSAFLWGKFGAAASQCPKSQRQCGFHKDLVKKLRLDEYR